MMKYSTFWLVIGLIMTVLGGGAQQASAACLYDMSPVSRNHGYGSATGTVSVATFNDCSWSASTTNSWISIVSGASGSGNGIVTYSLTANTNPVARTGAVMIAGLAFKVSQNPAACNYNLSPTARTHGYAMASGSVTMTTGSGCSWTATTTNDWINLQGSISGVGNGSFTYTVSANTNAFPRVGWITAADDFLIITQRAVNCPQSLSPGSRNHGYGGTTGLVTVAASGGCIWTAVSTNDWLTVLSHPTGTNNGEVIYTLSPNPNGWGRSGVILIGEQTFSVNQAAALCNFSVSPLTVNLESNEAGAGVVHVTGPGGCPWSASSPDSWISVGQETGTGSGPVNFTVQANPSGTPRSGTLLVAGLAVMINQGTPGPCSYQISPTNRNHGFGAASNVVTLTTSNHCEWTVVNTNSWVTVVNSNGIGPATVVYLVATNLSLEARSGVVQIGGQALMLTQDGASCGFSLSPGMRTHGYGATNNTVALTAAVTNCTWEVVNTNGWITVQPTNGVGSAVLTYSVAASQTLEPRTGAVIIAGQMLTIVQRAVECSYEISPATREHGYGGASGIVTITTLTGCPWTVVNTNDWIAVAAGLSNGTSNGSIDYAVAPNTSLVARTGVVMVADQVFTVIQSGFECSFKISPVSRTHGFGMATNTITVTTSSNCAWNAEKSGDWISIVEGAAGMGNGVITYMVSPNFTPLWRTGQVMVADQALIIAQRPGKDFSFDYIRLPDGMVELRMSGGPAGVWEVHESSNLVDWQLITKLTNITGTLQISGGQATNSHRFYKAIKAQ